MIDYIVGNTTICATSLKIIVKRNFAEHYETYNRLVDDYGQLVVDEFIEEFDVSTIENFADMIQGQYTSGAELAGMIALRFWICVKRYAKLD